MKKIAIIIVAIFATMALMPQPTPAPIFTIDSNGTITTNSEYIKPNYADRTLPANYTASEVISIPVGSTNYTLKLGDIGASSLDYEGDFLVVEFYKNNNLILIDKDADYIVKYANTRISDNYHMRCPSLEFREVADNDFFISVNLSPTAKAIIFMGQDYSTNVADMTIYVLTETDVKLVLRKELRALDVSKYNNEFNMLLQSNIEQIIDEETMQASLPILHEITLENGVLKFTDTSNPMN